MHHFIWDPCISFNFPIHMKRGWYPQIPSIFGLPTPQDPRLATINEKCVNNHVNDHFQGKYSLTRSLGALRILDLPSQIASLYLYISIKCWVRSPLSWAPQARCKAWEVYQWEHYLLDDPPRPGPNYVKSTIKFGMGQTSLLLKVPVYPSPFY